MYERAFMRTQPQRLYSRVPSPRTCAKRVLGKSAKSWMQARPSSPEAALLRYGALQKS
jgi:hypothetical protein